MNTIKAMQTLFSFKLSRGMSSSYVIFFSSTLLIFVNIYIYILWFFMYILKSNFRK